MGNETEDFGQRTRRNHEQRLRLRFPNFPPKDNGQQYHALRFRLRDCALSIRQKEKDEQHLQFCHIVWRPSDVQVPNSYVDKTCRKSKHQPACSVFQKVHIQFGSTYLLTNIIQNVYRLTKKNPDAYTYY